MRISGTGVFQIFVATSSWIVLVRILAGFGTLPVAGYTVAIRIVIFALMPAWGLSNAAATMVGQSLGAGKPERAERSVWMAGVADMVVLGVTGLLFVLFAPALVGFFTADPEIAHWGIVCLRVVGLGFPFYALGMVLAPAVQRGQRVELALDGPIGADGALLAAQQPDTQHLLQLGRQVQAVGQGQALFDQLVPERGAVVGVQG